MSKAQYNEQIERELLASVGGSTEAIGEARNMVTAHDFYVPRHRLLWQTFSDLYENGLRATVDQVRARMITDGTFEKLGGNAVLFEIMQTGIGRSRWRPIAEAVVSLSRRRSITELMSNAQQRLAVGEVNVYEVAEELSAALGDVRPLGAVPRGVFDGEEVMTAERTVERRTQWVIPGLMRQGWRTMVVAAEGAGKSILSRQFAVCASQGIHPLSFASIEPVRTLLVDLENPADVLLDWLQPLLERAQASTTRGFDGKRITVWHEPSGINLLKPIHRANFVATIEQARPQLVVLGPVYKAYRAGRYDEESTAELQSILDDLRTRYGFALLLEHHAPKGDGSARRELTPYGSSLWLRWPEFGIKLMTGDRPGSYKVKRFRGDRAEAAWPTELEHSDTWPWAGRWPTGTFTRDTDDF